MFVNVSDYGNTSAASVPIALDEAISGKAISVLEILYCFVPLVEVSPGEHPLLSGK